MIKSSTNLLKGFRGLAPAALLLLILWLLDSLVIRKMDKATCKAAVVFMAAINTAMQIICLLDLRVRPTWDFGAVMTGAADIAAGQPIRNNFYFQEYPFNLNPAVVIGTFKYILCGWEQAPYVLNIIAVTSSVAGACMTAWRVFSPQASVKAALFCLTATPLYLYIPIAYTDTLSMPFAIWSVYAWSRVRFPGASSAGTYRLPACASLGLLAAAGYLIKPIAAIGLLAFAADYFMCCGSYRFEPGYGKGGIRSFLKKLIPLSVAAAVFLAAIFSFRVYVDLKGFTARLDRNGRIPYTHWIMMGMNKPAAEGGTSYGYGGFSNDDLLFTRAFKTAGEREAADTAVIRLRLEEFGPTGYAAFLLKKLEWTWTDGTYYAPVKLGRYPVKLNVLHKFVLFSKGRSNKLYLAFTQLTQGLLLFLLFLSAVFSLRRRESGFSRFILLMSLGLALFLLFWETRSRYLTFMIPVFTVLAAGTAERLFTAMDKLPEKIGYKFRKSV